jgi:hypothetical protein
MANHPRGLERSPARSGDFSSREEIRALTVILKLNFLRFMKIALGTIAYAFGWLW